MPRFAQRTVGKNNTESITGCDRKSRRLSNCRITPKFFRRIGTKCSSERFREFAQRTVGKSNIESITGCVRTSCRLCSGEIAFNFFHRIGTKWFSERLREFAAAAYAKGWKVSQNQAGS